MKKLKWRFFTFIAVISLIAASNFILQAQDKAVTQSKDSQEKMSPSDALQMMKDGNTRFTESKMFSRNLLDQVHASAKNQYPYAVVLSCIDSRVAP